MNVASNTTQTERTTLYYREGSSDKVYQASIEPYGRRGSTMNTGTTTQTPVDHETATRIFTKLVNEKKEHTRNLGYDRRPCSCLGRSEYVSFP